MNDTNKENLIQFSKIAGIIVLAMVAIITAAGVWNGVYKEAIGSFYGWVAGLNLIVEGFGLYKLNKMLSKKEDKEKDK